jgi:hypothetical protein
MVWFLFWLTTRDTVAGETPASRAMSLMLNIFAILQTHSSNFLFYRKKIANDSS